MSDWESITADELRTAAKVARVSGGVIVAAAADAWELRADLLDGKSSLDRVFGN